MRNSKCNQSRCILTVVVLLFSQCKKDNESNDQEFYKGLLVKTIAAVASPLSSPQLDVLKELNVAYAGKDGDKYVLSGINAGVPGDSGSDPLASTLRVFENGIELGPAHSKHSDILKYGKGRFSHWGSHLYFSSSDNSDPRSNGRKYTFVTSTGEASATASNTTSVTQVSTPTTSSDPLALSNLIGYANVNGKTTGGQGGSSVTVTSFAALKRAVESLSPLIIKVSGRLTGTGSLNVKSNKSIVGLNGAICEGFGLRMAKASNVVIQNLTIRNVVNRDDDDCINVKNSNHVWIDHCDLSADRDHLNWDYYDGLIDISRQSSYITISWSKLHDSYKPMLIGADDAATNDAGYLKVTLYKNYFYNVSERGPRVRFGYVHVFNNYQKNTNSYSLASSMGAVVRTDNNYFDGVSVPIRTDVGFKPGYVSGAGTNKFVSCGLNRITTSALAWTPASIYSYNSALLPVDQVPSVVMAGAGPK